MKYGRYEIVKELGKGSMGMVYLARDPNIGRLVALKILRIDRVSSEEFMQRFLKEARVIGRLSHPNIVSVYDIGEDHGTAYIAMEYLEGSPLNEAMEERTPTVPDIIAVGVSVAETLDYAHRKGIVHRDVKPSNIIVLPDGQVKLTDFGIAHIEDPEAAQQTQAGTILGTPAYMSPEQVLGHAVDGRSDLFSLGVILYEMATGERPFAGESLTVIFRGITSAEPTEIIRIKPQVSQDLSRIIMKSLSKDPEARYSSGREMAEALEEFRDGVTAQQKTVISLPRGREKASYSSANKPYGGSKKKPKSRIPALLSVIAILIVVAVGAVASHFYLAKKDTLPAGPAPTEPAPFQQPRNWPVPAPESSAPADSRPKFDLQPPSGGAVPPLARSPGPELTVEPAPQAREEILPSLPPPAKEELFSAPPPALKQEPSPFLSAQPVPAPAPEQARADSISPMEDEKAKRVADLLAKARTAYDRGEILAPEATSAVHYYKGVFAIDDQDVDAYTGVMRAIRKYLESANRAVKDGKTSGKSSLSLIKQCIDAIPEALKGEHREEIDDVKSEIQALTSHFDALDARAKQATTKEKIAAPRKTARPQQQSPQKESTGANRHGILTEKMSPEPKILHEHM